MVHRSLSNLFKNQQVREWLLNPHDSRRTAKQLFTQDNIDAAILFTWYKSEDKNVSLAKQDNIKETSWHVPVAATANYFLCLTFSESYPFIVPKDQHFSCIRKFVVDKSSKDELTTFMIIWRNEVEAIIFVNHVLEDGTIRSEHYDVLVDDRLAVPKVLGISVLHDTGACSHCLLHGVPCTCPDSFKKKALGHIRPSNTWMDWVSQLEALRKRYFSEVKIYEYQGDFSTSVMEIDASKQVHIYRNVNEAHPLQPSRINTSYINGWINLDKNSQEMRIEREKWMQYLSTSTKNGSKRDKILFSLSHSHSMISDTSRGHSAGSVMATAIHGNNSKSDSGGKLSTCFLCELSYENTEQFLAHISKKHCPFTASKESSRWEVSRNNDSLSRILNAGPSIEDAGNNFFCQVCSQCFSSKRLLKDHIRVSHARFSLNMVENTAIDRISIGSFEFVNSFSTIPSQHRSAAISAAQDAQSVLTPSVHQAVESTPLFQAVDAVDTVNAFEAGNAVQRIQPDLTKLMVFASRAGPNATIVPAQHEKDQVTSPTKSQKRKSGTQGQDTERQKVRCDRCSASFVTMTNLRKHIRSIHENFKPHSCPMCPMSFYQKSDFRRHSQAIHGNSFSV